MPIMIKVSRKVFGIMIVICCATHQSAWAQMPVTLNGKLSDWMGSDTLSLSYRVAQGVDTTIFIPIVNGVFHYNDSFAAPVRVRLRDREDRRPPHDVDHAFIYLVPGKTSHMVGRQSLGGARVRGTVLQRQYRKLRRQLIRSRNKRLNLRQHLDEVVEEGDGREGQRYRELKARSATRQARLGKQLTDFVHNHPGSIVSLDALQSYLLDVGKANKGITLYNGLDSAVRFTPLGKEIGEQLAVNEYEKGSNDPLPEFTSFGPEGEAISLSDVLEGKQLLLLSFWASWDPYSGQESISLRKIYHAFHRIGFEILGISLDEHPSHWEEAIEERCYQWPQVSSLKGWAEPIARLCGVTALPTHILVNGEGEVVATGLQGEELYVFVRDFLVAD